MQYLRSLLVRNTTLSYLAWHYNFHTLVRPARALHHLDQKEVADLFEAYLGAVSLESHGERKAAAWVTAIFSPSVFPDAGEVARQINNGKENEDFWDDPVGDLREALDVVEKTSACASGRSKHAKETRMLLTLGSAQVTYPPQPRSATSTVVKRSTNDWPPCPSKIPRTSLALSLSTRLFSC